MESRAAFTNPAFNHRLISRRRAAGIGLLTVADAGWAHALGVISLLAFVACGYRALLPDDLAQPRPTSER